MFTRWVYFIPCLKTGPLFLERESTTGSAATPHVARVARTMPIYDERTSIGRNKVMDVALVSATGSSSYDQQIAQLS